MKRHIYIAIVALVCLGFFWSFAVPGDQALAASADEKITVLTPMGHPPTIKLKPMAKRPATLDGKTVYIVDNIYPGSDLLLTEMEAWFNREMPGTTAIYKRKNAMGGFEALDEALWAEIKEKADAVIIGLGH